MIGYFLANVFHPVPNTFFPTNPFNTAVKVYLATYGSVTTNLGSIV